MITIKMTTSHPKAVELARRLMASKREAQNEIREFAKTPEFRQAMEDLRKKNAGNK